MKIRHPVLSCPPCIERWCWFAWCWLSDNVDWHPRSDINSYKYAARFFIRIHCNTLQHTATHCNTLQHMYLPILTTVYLMHCNTLQHNITHCNICISRFSHPSNSLQLTATHCNKRIFRFSHPSSRLCLEKKSCVNRNMCINASEVIRNT